MTDREQMIRTGTRIAYIIVGSAILSMGYMMFMIWKLVELADTLSVST